VDEVFVAVFVDDEANEGRDDPVFADDLGDDELAEAVAFFVPLSWQGLLLGVGRHVPLLPLLGVVDEGSDDVKEVWQLVEIADGVPVRGFDPLVGVNGLVFPIDGDVLAAFEEEVVLLPVHFLESDCHHEAK
jgi:hypothetical protein